MTLLEPAIRHFLLNQAGCSYGQTLSKMIHSDEQISTNASRKGEL